MATEDKGPPSPTGDRQAAPARTPREGRARNHVLLVIEDDPVFARIVGDLASRQGFRPIVAFRGDVGLAMARQFQPDAIFLDVRLPGLDGWVLLDQFKHDAGTRPIPVVIVSGDERGPRARRRGAFDHLMKPVQGGGLEAAIARVDAFVGRSERRLLVVDGDSARRRDVLDFIAGTRVRAAEVDSGREALAALAEGSFDCVIAARTLPDMTAKDLAAKIARDDALRRTPVIIRTNGDGAPAPDLKGLSDAAVIREAPTLEALIDATTLFLHLAHNELTDSNRRMLERIRRANPILAGKRVLVVDDDARNVFALKSLLETHKMSILSAYSGREGLDVLARESAVDLVLMDVMMPEMDGYEAIRAIRQVGAWETLPIFALTAKAMKGDRERCLEAGASDYIPKPVDTEQLLSLLRVWLGP